MRTRTLLVTLASAILLASCGGGGGGSVANNMPATVGVLVGDAPVGQWDQAIATITSVTLIGDSGQVTLFTGSETLDLLKLADFSELFATSDNVPPGQYSKIRLHLSDLVLNDLDDTGAVVTSVHPQLVGNGKLDLVPREPFAIAPGAVMFVELDFDMEKSLKITETGSGKLIVRPVVFVKIHRDFAVDRFARIHGNITEVDPAAGTLVLCQTDFASRWDRDAAGQSTAAHSEDGEDGENDGDDDDQGGGGSAGSRCLTANTDEATGIFGSDGLPQDFAGLAVGEEATVIGRLHRLDTPVPAPLENTGDAPQFGLDAVVIEEGPLGTFRRIAGKAATTVDAVTGQFGLDVAPGQGLATDAPLPVQLYDHSRIFNRLGEELTRDDITIGRGVLADGVLQVGTEDLLRSPLVILAPVLPVETVLKGTIASVDTTAGSLIVTTDTGDRCVDAGAADVFLVSQADGLEFARGALADLVAGHRVAVFGSEGTDGCLTASTIIAEQ